jgi:phosphocarrier protein
LAKSIGGRAVVFRAAVVGFRRKISFMNERTLSRKVTVINEQGLHMRPLDIFVKRANQFDATIEVIRETERADGKSILEIMTLGAERGTELLIVATGRDAEAALSALVELVETGFAEAK